ncbi:g5412 [Coccomyxa elongata]
MGAEIPISSLKCMAATEDSRQLCFLKNVAIWHGKIYFIQEGPFKMPDLTVTSWGPSEALLHLDRYVSVVEPGHVPFRGLSNLSHHSHGVLQHASMPSNHAHNMLETLPALYNRICSLFGMCDYIDSRIREHGGLLLVWVEKLHGNLKSMQTITACMSNRQIELGEELIRDVFTVDELMVGFLSKHACKTDALCIRHNDLSEAELVNKRLRFMRSCANLPADPPMRLKGPPRLLLINRPHKAGRSILALPEVYEFFQDRTARHSLASAKFTYMEGKSITEQAKLMNGADIIVIPHGAAFGNLLFAPQRSIILHIGASEGHINFNEGHIHALDAALNLSSITIPVASIGGLDVISSRLSDASSPIHQWTQAQLLHFIIRGDCANDLSQDPYCSDYNHLSRLFNYAVSAELIVEKIKKAIEAWNAFRA